MFLEMNRFSKLAIFYILFFFAYLPVKADVLYLINGRSIEGIITREDDDTVELEVSSGIVKFRRQDIGRIATSSPSEYSSIRRKWEKEKKEAERNMTRRAQEEERRPKEVVLVSSSPHTITVNALLNKQASVNLLLDTGASIVLLRKTVAGKLGINLNDIKPDLKITVADGRQVGAKSLILENLKIEDAEADNVQAAVLLEEAGSVDFGDGLLGMSFLKRFNFKVDQQNKKLILEKL